MRLYWKTTRPFDVTDIFITCMSIVLKSIISCTSGNLAVLPSLTMMLGFHIANDFEEILLGYIFAEYKIVGIGFSCTDYRRNNVPMPYRSSEMCHFVCTNAIPPNFTNVLF
jgi:hypothetical protein